MIKANVSVTIRIRIQKDHLGGGGLKVLPAMLDYLLDFFQLMFSWRGPWLITIV